MTIYNISKLFEEEENYDSGMERLTTILAVLAAVLIGCIVLFLVGRAFGLFEFGLPAEKEETTQEEEKKPDVAMIDVVGKNIDEVKVSLLEINLTPEIEYEESTEYEQGIVMNASVSSGTMVEEGTNIVLTVSAGSEGVEVPDVVGATKASFRPEHSAGIPMARQASTITLSCRCRS